MSQVLLVSFPIRAISPCKSKVSVTKQNKKEKHKIFQEYYTKREYYHPKYSGKTIQLKEHECGECMCLLGVRKIRREDQ
jgi:hypothetical protein